MTESYQKLQLEQMRSAIAIKELTDQELADTCKAGGREAWGEFFIRFVPEMRRAIVRVLRKRAGNNLFIADEDNVVWDILEKIVIKLKQGGLSGCRDTKGIHPWLRTVAANQARDVLKGEDTDENLPAKDAARGIIFLDAPVVEGSDTTHMEMLSVYGLYNECEPFDFESIHLAPAKNDLHDALLSELSKMEDRRKFWILRLAILLEDSLVQDEIDELVRFSPLPETEVRAKIQLMIDEVDCKREQREADLGRVVLYHHQQLRLEKMLYIAKGDDSANGAKTVADLKEKITAKSRQRADVLKATARLPRPSNRAIAELVGISEQQEGQVTTILSRLQEKIAEGWGRANKDVQESGKKDIDFKDYLNL